MLSVLFEIKQIFSASVFATVRETVFVTDNVIRDFVVTKTRNKNGQAFVNVVERKLYFQEIINKVIYLRY